ncbi:MAG: hypothetical protein APF76_12750 [Desulfitibacter sp. BRH_c19]|nr:MAG: hypothetical protein APF76_12750 [Desulfitibacter sp. BRH_c19]
MIFEVGETLGLKIAPTTKFANHGNVRRKLPQKMQWNVNGIKILFWWENSFSFTNYKKSVYLIIVRFSGLDNYSD